MKCATAFLVAATAMLMLVPAAPAGAPTGTEKPPAPETHAAQGTGGRVVTADSLSDGDLGKTCIVTIPNLGSGGGPIPPPGMVTIEGNEKRLRGRLSAITKDEVVLDFPPPATYGKMHMPRDAILSVVFIAEAPKVWVTLALLSPIRSFKEYRHVLGTTPPPQPPLYRPQPIAECEFEIRRMVDAEGKTTQNRIARLPYAGSFRGEGVPGPEDLRRLGDLANGEYLVALVVGDARCSNVSRLVIDPKFDAAKQPALRVAPMPPTPGLDQAFFALIATGRTPVDSEFTNDTAAFPVLVVDGVERHLTQQTWVGPTGPLPSGHRDIRLHGGFAFYKPEVAPGKHTVVAKVGNYESAPVTVPADDEWGALWDKATPNLPPAPPPHVSVRGTVAGPDGKAAAGYEVNLFGAADKFSTRCDTAGKYEFLNIPAGEFRLSANPPGKGQPEVAVKKVVIELLGKVKPTLTYDLSMEAKYAFSGRVMTADGKPAAGREVMANGPSPDGWMEWADFAVVGPDGRYTIHATYAVASYIGLSGTGRQPAPYHSVKAGRTDLDFVVSAPPPAAAPRPYRE